MAKIEKLKPFQETAIANTVAAFRSADRAKVIMPCGTGKTIVGIKIREQLKPKRTIIVTPSLALVKQLLDSYVTESSLQSALVVCSDNTTANEARNQFNIPRVTTNPEEIAKELRKRDNVVVFSTYQSTPKIAECFQGKGVPRFDLGIFDESHHMATISKIFTTALEDSAIPIRKRLFMTATPRVAMDRDRKNAEIDGYTIACMDDESQFGKESFHMSFGEAIRDGHLTDYQVAIFAVKESDIRSMIANDEDIAGLAKRVALVQAMRQYDLRKVLVYHRSVKSMNWFAEIGIRQTYEQVKEAKKDKCGLWSESMDGGDSAKKRKKILDAFRNISGDRRAILNSCRTLQEGVDCPAVDAICLLDPRKQPIDIVQIVGRAIRNSPDKKIATIILPVFMPENAESDPGAFVESAEFSDVWDMLAALKSHDERIKGWVSQSGSNSKKSLPINVVFGGSKLPISLQGKMINAIQSRIAKTIDRQLLTEDLVWKWMQEHYKHHGRWPVRRIKSGHENQVAPDGSTWGSIRDALSCGYRGLMGGSSLLKLRLKKSGKNQLLTEDLIWEWMQSFFNENGKWPTSASCEIAPNGDSWLAINASMRKGRFGLSPNGGLSKLRSEKLGYSVLSEDLIVDWMESYFKQFRKWPKNKDTAIAPCGITWKAVSFALRAGTRGLAGSSSFLVLRRKYFNKDGSRK
jgi:predicted helicase